ncbi:hypothetical protein BMS3Bbin10_00951 [bacterium BMS3Bbin10]|nr:hypothetical protein BMS3Bbin10_00951 [bacterium BMS3Bbin10]
MSSRILAILGILALPATALADVGHIADQGGGHSHWGIYILIAGALFGFGLWARAYLNRR